MMEFISIALLTKIPVVLKDMIQKILITLLLMSFQISYAQNPPATIIAQSNDRPVIKLAWYFDHWSSDITGFDIKRKQGNKDWVKLNNSPILPGISLQNNIGNVEADKAEQTRINSKLTKLLAEKKLNGIDHTTFLQQLNTDSNFIKNIRLITELDYDKALMMGFAFVDRSVPGANTYEYGLFIQGTDKLIASTTKNNGDRENLAIIHDVRVKPSLKGKTIQLMWHADKELFTAEHVIGFYIYKNNVKISDKPLLASAGMAEYVWNDSVDDINNPVRYGISPVTALGIEGDENQYSYNPADFPKEYKSADIENIIWQDNDMKTILKVTWTYPREYEHFIKGFYVEKDRMPEGYKQVSELLAPSARIFVPSAREFIDTTPITLKSYIRFRIVVLYNDETEITGSDMRFYYFPFTQPPRPENLKAECVRGDDKFIVNLNWDPPMKGDSLTDYYQVYASDPITNRLYLEMGITPPIKINKYKYEIQYSTANKYDFCTQAVGINRVESKLSDTASVIAPSLALPVPDIKKLTLDSNKVVITWDYPPVLDLKGFRLYQNKNLVAGEMEITKDKHEFTTPPLKWNANYAFSLQAISQTGVLSEISIPAYITIIPKPK